MKKRRYSGILAAVLCVVLLLSLGLVQSTEGATQTLFIDPIEDQSARIIVASETGGVDWGSEPVVLTLNVSEADAEISVTVRDEDMLASSLSGLNGNVLTLVPLDKVGYTSVTVTATYNQQVANETFIVVVNKYEDTGEYHWGDIRIPGGGAVCGYIFHPNVPGILYAQTDVGGAHRFNFETRAWEDITQWITPLTQGAGQSRGLGIDPTPGREDWVYLAYGNGILMLSKDRGDTWVTHSNIGIAMGGNAGNLRGLGGDNIVVIPNRNEAGVYGIPTIYAVSHGGIRQSNDDGITWTNIASNFDNATQYTFVVFDSHNTDLRVVGAAMPVAVNGAYFSADAGETWAQLPGQPERRSPASMYFPTRAAFTAPHNEEGNRYLFVTYNDSGSNTAGVNDGNGADGAVFRWEIAANGTVLGDGVNVTPVMIWETAVRSVAATGTQNRMSGVGMSALSVDPQIPGALVVGTHNTDPYNIDLRHNQRGMETLFRSLDYGETWFPVVAGYNMYGYLAWGELAPFAAPAVNGQFNTNRWADPELGLGNDPAAQLANDYWWEPWTFLHWNFGPQINPFDSDNLFINSGLGTYVTYNLTALDHLAEYAVPNAKTLRGLTVEEARLGLFTTTNGRIDDNRLTSLYPEFRIASIDFPDGGVTADTSVKWETAPDLFMTVQKASALYSPPSGRNIVLTNTWDYPGWAFESTDHLPWNGWSYAQWIPPRWEYAFEEWREITANMDPRYLPPRPDTGQVYSIYAPTNRGISGDNTDFPDGNPDIIVSTSRMDWHFNAKGGAIISFDGGLIWHSLPDGWEQTNPYHDQILASYALLGMGNGMPNAQTQNAANALKVNNTAAGVACGHVAISADATTIIWGIGNMQVQNTVYTKADDPIELGQTWGLPTFFSNAEGTATLPGTTVIRVMSDRVDPDVFYGFTNAGIFVSRDGGRTFFPATITSTDGIAFPFGGMQTGANAGRAVRGEVGNPYVLWVDGNALFRLVYDKETNSIETTRVVAIQDGSPQFGMSAGSNGRAGLGLGIDGVANAALYAHGRTAPVVGDAGTGFGVYRSLDGGETWLKISPSTDNPEPAGTVEDPFLNANLAFADVRGVIGDPRIFGRVYLTQGNVAGGIRYGDIIVNKIACGATYAVRTELGDIIEEALTLSSENFSGPNWRLFSPALAHAQNLLNNLDATHAEIVNATNTLSNLVNRQL